MNHEMGQLAAMFYQLGKAAALMVGDQYRLVDPKTQCHALVRQSPPDGSGIASFQAIDKTGAV